MEKISGPSDANYQNVNNRTGQTPVNQVVYSGREVTRNAPNETAAIPRPQSPPPGSAVPVGQTHEVQPQAPDTMVSKLMTALWKQIPWFGAATPQPNIQQPPAIDFGDLPEILKAITDGEITNEEFRYLAANAFGSVEFNHEMQRIKRREPELYRANEVAVNALAHFSYISQKSDEFLRLGEKRDRLLGKLENGEKIEESEKISPEEAHLIDSMLDQVVFSQLDRIDEREPVEKIGETLVKIRAVNDERYKWKDFAATQMNSNHRPGDFMFIQGDHYGKYHHGAQTNLTRMVPIATGANNQHASIFIATSKGPKESHVVGNYCQQQLAIGRASFTVSVRRDAWASLTPEGQQACKLMNVSKDQVAKIKEEITNQLHREFADNPDMRQIHNGDLPLMKSVWGEANPTAGGNLGLSEMPIKRMVCSQFAKYSSDIVDYRLNERLKEMLKESDLKNELSQKFLASNCNLVRPLFQEDWMSPTPASLLHKIVEGTAEEWEPVPQSKQMQAVFQLPKLSDTVGLNYSQRVLMHDMRERYATFKMVSLNE